MHTAWFTAFVSTICLEGLGRKYLPWIPAGVFYFAKALVLLLGFFLFRPSVAISRAGLSLYRGFKIVWLAGVIWTIAELLNPKHQSLTLGLIGLRAYWLWWCAPFVVASALQHEKHKRRAIYVLLAVST